MLLAKIFIFFVLKKNNSFQLYVDYYGLNAIIVKNCYFLLLITETLNHLYKIVIFTKINLKDIYYWIYIILKNE